MNSHFSPKIEAIRRESRKLPNFSEIAREENVTPGHVRRVFWGMTVSARISKAIERKVTQRERKLRDRERAA